MQRPHTPTNANPHQRRRLDALRRDGHRVIATAAAGQTLRVIIIDAHSGLSRPHTITRQGFLT